MAIGGQSGNIAAVMLSLAVTLATPACGKAGQQPTLDRSGPDAGASFVIAGGAEARSGAGSYPERIVRYRDLSADGFAEKVRFTVAAQGDPLLIDAMEAAR